MASGFDDGPSEKAKKFFETWGPLLEDFAEKYRLLLDRYPKGNGSWQFLFRNATGWRGSIMIAPKGEEGFIVDSFWTDLKSELNVASYLAIGAVTQPTSSVNLMQKTLETRLIDVLSGKGEVVLGKYRIQNDLEARKKKMAEAADLPIALRPDQGSSN